MKRLKERVWRCFDWRKRPMILFSALSVFKLLHIWPLTVWTLHASKQRKWLPKWLRLLWVLVVRPGVSSHSADSWAGQATYHLQMYIQKMLKAWLHTLGWWWLISTSFLIHHLFRFSLWARFAHIISVFLTWMYKSVILQIKINWALIITVTEINQLVTVNLFATRQICNQTNFGGRNLLSKARINTISTVGVLVTVATQKWFHFEVSVGLHGAAEQGNAGFNLFVNPIRSKRLHDLCYSNETSEGGVSPLSVLCLLPLLSSSHIILSLRVWRILTYAAHVDDICSGLKNVSERRCSHRHKVHWRAAFVGVYGTFLSLINSQCGSSFSALE